MRAWLLQRGVELDERDFFQERFSADEIRRLIGDRPASELFSWNSPSFRKMGIDRDTLNDNQLVAMMVDEPRLIRRPLIEVDGRLVIGADLRALDEALT